MLLHLIVIVISIFLFLVRICSLATKLVVLYEESKLGLVKPEGFIVKLWLRYLLFWGYYLYRINRLDFHYHAYYKYRKYKTICKLVHIYNRNLSIIDDFFFL